MTHKTNFNAPKLSDKSPKEKKRIIQGFLKKKVEVKKIARELKVSRQTIEYWIRKLEIPYDGQKINRRRYDRIIEENRKRKKPIYEEALKLFKKGYGITDTAKIVYAESYPNKNSSFYASKLRQLLDSFGYRGCPSKIRVDGKRLRSLRKSAGLRQKDIGSQAIIHSYEKNGTISLKNLKRLAEKFGVEHEYLMLNRKNKS